MAYGIDQVVIIPFYLPFIGVFFRLILTEDDVYLRLPQLALLFLIPAVYDFIFLVMLQATPGKWLMGLKVVPFSNSSGKLEWTQCLLRPLTARLSFFFSWAIYAVAFFRYDRTHLCDWLAETRVVQKTPRMVLPRLRWIAGTVLVILYAYEGLVSSQIILKAIDWSNGQADVRAVLDLQDYVDMELEE